MVYVTFLVFVVTLLFTVEAVSGHIPLHIAYAKYVKSHLREVRKICIQLGIPMLGYLHDLSRFYPTSWYKYAIGRVYEKDADKSPESVAGKAWSAHWKLNKHHYPYWITYHYVTMQPYALRMPRRYILEMFADMVGASRAKMGDAWTPNANTKWWIERQEIFQKALHQDTFTILNLVFDRFNNSGADVDFKQVGAFIRSICDKNGVLNEHYGK